MKNNKGFNLGWYLFAGIMGMISGACFSKSMYYKGRADAANEIKEEIEKVAKEWEEKVDVNSED